MTSDLAILAAAWLTYFFIHSLLASLPVKRMVAQRWPELMPAYRLLFNALAILLLIPPLWLTYHGDYTTLWAWNGAAAWLANGLALLAIALFAWSLRFYDGGEFSGLRQWRQGIRTVEDQEAFHISPLHRWVRHPWYALGLVILWTRDMNSGMLLTVTLATLYFWLGSRLEERKLLEYHGEAYREYRRRVPGLLPLPWKRLSREGVETILAINRRAAKSR
jgi:protein-S-isoprenylcysteine O-methyltransferase Ste14